MFQTKLLIIVLITPNLITYGQELDSLQQGYLQSPSDTLKIEYLLSISNYYRNRDSDSMKQYAKSAIQLSEQTQYQMGLANGHQLKGTAHFFQGDLDAAELEFHIALDLFNDLHITSKILNLHYLIGLVHFRRSEYDIALVKFDDLIGSARLAKDPENISKGHLMKGVIYSNMGNPARALDAYYQSLAIEDSLENVSVQSMLFNNIGIIHHEQNELKRAENIYRRSLGITPVEPSRHRANVHISLSNVFLETGQIDSALYYAQIGLGDYRAIKEGYEVVTALHQLSSVYLQLGEMDSARYYAEQTLVIAERTNNLEKLAYSLLILGQMNLNDEQPAEAETQLEEALEVGKAIPSLAIQRDVHLQLAKLHEKTRDYPKALQHTKVFQQLKDSLSNESNTRQLTRLEDEYEFEKEKSALLAEQERKELSLQTTLAKQRLQFIIALIIGAAVLIITAILYQLYRQKVAANIELKNRNRVIENQSATIAQAASKEKYLLHQKIDIQKRELATFAMQANEKNSLLNQIREGLKELDLKAGQKKQARELERIISSSVHNNNAWDSFLHKFEAIYPEFFTRLKKEFSDLTLNELKLCGYIKIGMTNTEIVNVTSTATSTVKKNVNRLKKKLDLTGDDSIRDFIIGYY